MLVPIRILPWHIFAKLQNCIGNSEKCCTESPRPVYFKYLPVVSIRNVLRGMWGSWCRLRNVAIIHILSSVSFLSGIRCKLTKRGSGSAFQWPC